MVEPCRGKKIGRIGTSFGISFLQTGASLRKVRGSERERVTFVCIIQFEIQAHVPVHQSSLENHMCVLG